MKVIAPQGDQYDVDVQLCCRGHNRGRRLRLDAGCGVPGVETARGDRRRAFTVREDRDAVVCGAKVSAVDGADNSRTNHQYVHRVLPPFGPGRGWRPRPASVRCDPTHSLRRPGSGLLTTAVPQEP